MGDMILRELALQSRSRWTWTLLLISLAIAVVGALSTGSSARTVWDDYTRLSAQKFVDRSWLVSDPEGQLMRESLSLVRPNHAANLALTIAGSVGLIVIGMWGASVIGSEFAKRTVRVRAAHDGWRRAVLAKVGAGAAGVVVFVLLVLATGVAAGFVVWNMTIRSYPDLTGVPDAVPTHSILPGLAAVIVGLAVYGLLGGVAALATRNLAVGVLVPIALPNIERYVDAWWLPTSVVQCLYRQTLQFPSASFVTINPPKSLPPAPWAPWAVVAVWVLALSLCLYFVAGRQEIQ